MIISLIAAIGKNNELGLNNKLIWNIPSDLKFFRNVTLNKTVLMGSNTYYSIGRPLPKRNNIVLTHRNIDNDKITVYSSVFKFIEDYKNYQDEIFIIGGASIYREFIDMADNLYLTEIEEECSDADTYFPKFDKKQYDKEFIDECVENGIAYKHILYKRRKYER